MALIYETKNFILESHENPEIDRLEGGHVKISPKVDVSDRSMLSPKLAVELMRFTVVSGRAMVLGMKKSGVNIGRINYQENGNWKPHLHIHLYCRAVDAVNQKFGDPITPGHKDGYVALSKADIGYVFKEVERLFLTEEFSDSNWRV